MTSVNGFIADPWVDLASVKASLTLGSTTAADPDILRAIASAQTAINDATKRRFDRDPTIVQARIYRPANAVEIWIDDCVEVTLLETDQDGDFDYERTWTPDNEFRMWPANARLDGEPLRCIQLNTYRASAGFPYWIPQSVRVTGKWGWADRTGAWYVPTNIQTATRLLASRLMNRFRSPAGVIPMGMDQGAAYIVRTDPDVASLIREFCREKPGESY